MSSSVAGRGAATAGGTPARRGQADALRVPRVGPRAAAVAADPKDAWRWEPPARKQAYARRHEAQARSRGVDAATLSDPREVDRVLEAVIGESELLPGRWIRHAAATAEAVARIRTPTTFGTGFLVSPWLLMTNQHVLTGAAVARDSTATFRYEENDDEELHGTVKLALQPERCFVSSPVAELDLGLVAVAPTADGGPPGAMFGHIPADGGIGKILLGQPVNIVQHPDGRPREIAVRNNRLLAVDDPVAITYETDTEGGSSGAPVLNDHWELVALHHSAQSSGGTAVANIGIRISAIVAHVRGLVADPAALAGAGSEAATLLGEFLDVGEP